MAWSDAVEAASRAFWGFEAVCLVGALYIATPGGAHPQAVAYIKSIPSAVLSEAEFKAELLPHIDDREGFYSALYRVNSQLNYPLGDLTDFKLGTFYRFNDLSDSGLNLWDHSIEEDYDFLFDEHKDIDGNTRRRLSCYPRLDDNSIRKALSSLDGEVVGIYEDGCADGKCKMVVSTPTSTVVISPYLNCRSYFSFSPGKYLAKKAGLISEDRHPRNLGRGLAQIEDFNSVREEISEMKPREAIDDLQPETKVPVLDIDLPAPLGWILFPFAEIAVATLLFVKILDLRVASLEQDAAASGAIFLSHEPLKKFLFSTLCVLAILPQLALFDNITLPGEALQAAFGFAMILTLSTLVGTSWRMIEEIRDRLKDRG